MRHFLAAIALAAVLPIAAVAQSTPPGATITPVPTGPSSTITPAPAAAAPAVKPPPLSPEALKEAHALTDILGIPAQAKALMQGIRNQVIQASLNAGSKSMADASAIADEIVMPDFNAREPQLANLLVTPWAYGFTVPELKELQAFYKTPLGRRLLATMPTIGQQTARLTQEWMQTNFREIVQKHADELHARGLKF